MVLSVRLRQTAAKLYLVQFVGMQLQPRLQQAAVDVMINFLAKQRGSYVT